MEELEAAAARLRIQLSASRAVYVDYIRDRMQAEDWHGCQDAGSDLREIDAKLEVLDLLGL